MKFNLPFLALAFFVAFIAADTDDEKPQETYYDIMRVLPAASEKELRTAYRKLAMMHHPDRAKSASDKQLKHERFVRLANVYEVLADTTLRGRYDWLLTQGKMEYDPNLDWINFDSEHGFTTPVDTQWGRMSFEDAQRMYAQAEWEAKKETYALIGCILTAVSAGLVPLFLSWRKKQKAASRKKGAKSNMKEEQRVLAEMRREQEAAKRAHDNNDNNNNNNNNDNDNDNDNDDNNDKDDKDDDNDNNNNNNNTALFKCDVCKKKFKSEKQRINHENSKKHKEAVKAAGGRRKGGAKAAAKAALEAMGDLDESELEEATRKKNKKNNKKNKKKQQLQDLLDNNDEEEGGDAVSAPTTTAKAKGPKKSRRNAATKEENKKKRKEGNKDEED